jgi:hypothetical protein
MFDHGRNRIKEILIRDFYLRNGEALREEETSRKYYFFHVIASLTGYGIPVNCIC